MSFEIKLPLFKGPFDLLLFFIERDELDIYDIPISQITNDFLKYLSELEEMNIEVASEFILVAATLMRIKAKMLLPRPQLDEEGNEIDPRDELVRHLLEYKKYKSVVGKLSEMEEEVSQLEKRGNITNELKSLAEGTNVEWELQNISLYKLLKVYLNALDKYEIEKNKPIHEVVQYHLSVEDQKKFLLNKISTSSKVSFEDIIKEYPSKIGLIFNFLAILELLQLRIINIRVGLGYNNFWIEKFKNKH